MSNNLGYIALTTGQSNKEGTINSSLSQIDAALTEKLSINVLDTDTTIAPTVSQFQDALIVTLSPDAISPPLSGTSVILDVPNVQKTVVLENLCDCAFIVTLGANTFDLLPNSLVTIFVDGTTIRVLSSSDSVLIATTATYAHGSPVTIATDLNNGDTLGGITLATDDVVLLFNQTASEDNGFYVVGATPVRAAFASITGQIKKDQVFFIEAGRYKGKAFKYTAAIFDVGPVGFSKTFALIGDLEEHVFSTFDVGTPAASSVVYAHVAATDFFFGNNFQSSKATTVTNPSSSTVFTVKKNGTTFGQVTISTAGVGTFLGTGSSEYYFAVNDILTVHSPASLNGLAGLGMTFRAFVHK